MSYDEIIALLEEKQAPIGDEIMDIPIHTTEEFIDFMYKIRDLNKTENGKKVYAFGYAGDGNDNCVIVGIGINVNQTEFKGDFNAPPTSVKLETNKTVNIKKFKKTVYKIIKKELKLYKKDKSDYIKIVNEFNYLKDKTVYAEINGTKTKVVCKDINPNGTLNVMINGEQKPVLSGEITFHL